MSTAKSMATSYLNNKRSTGKITPSRFKSSTSNLAANKTASSSSSPRFKSTSMTNLLADQETATATAGQAQSNPSGSRIQRPVSRNALDNIHNGMNAKYAQVQSKVLLQNIRPQQHNSPTKIPAASGASKSSTLQDGRRMGRTTPAATQSDRLAMQNKLKSLEEELSKAETEREQLKQELERERLDKVEQVNQLKVELQEKLAEHDKHNEEYHQKLLEAYELADQNRRAADSVLTESRQRDEESRKKVEELEGQLNELKEFVAMKEEMTGKMFELREQMREERQRYEEQLKSLHQVFENEKIRLEMDLMEKVRQVGENYELNKYKALNKTIELDARLANDRLLATKFRLSQVNAMNDKLSKQLRLAQQQFQVQEKKLLLTETMLRQLIESRDAWHHHHHHHLRQTPVANTGRLARFRGRPTPGSKAPTPVASQATQVDGGYSSGAQVAVGGEIGLSDNGGAARQQLQLIENGVKRNGSLDRKVSNSATQTQMSRTKTIISDLRQRLNLVGSRGKGLRDNSGAVAVEPLASSPASTAASSAAVLEHMARQAEHLAIQRSGGNNNGNAGNGNEDNDDAELDADEQELEVYDAELDNDLLLQALDLRRRSISLSNILDTHGGSYLHELATGQQIIISRGWPKRSHRTNRKSSSRRRSRSASRVELTQHGRSGKLRLDDQEKLGLLVRYLRSSGGGESSQVLKVSPASSRRNSRSNASRDGEVSKKNKTKDLLVTNGSQRPPVNYDRVSRSNGSPVNGRAATSRTASPVRRSGTRSRQSLIVQYDLPIHSAANGAIALGAATAAD